MRCGRFWRGPRCTFAVRGPHSPRRAESAAQRVDDARAGLPFLELAWRDGAASANDLHQVETLRGRFEKAPIARAKQALRAEVLIVAMDEASTSGPTELDGERPHDVHVIVADLRASSVVVRVQKRVDPNWISTALRPQYARELDSCALAFDVRESVALRWGH